MFTGKPSLAWLGCIIKWGVGYNPCYTPTEIGTVTEGSGSMEMATVHSINAVLHTSVFLVIDMTIQGKEKTSSYMAHMHIQKGVDLNPCYIPT